MKTSELTQIGFGCLRIYLKLLKQAVKFRIRNIFIRRALSYPLKQIYHVFSLNTPIIFADCVVKVQTFELLVVSFIKVLKCPLRTPV